MLKRLLTELECQRTDDRFTYSIVVTDNDSEQSAGPIVTEFAAKSSISTSYCLEPQKNIALARNRALKNAYGDFVAFIDDDEFPVKDWLLSLFETCTRHGAAGVLGPVKPHFEREPPAWIRRGGFCERPSHATGRVMRWNECRTGNLLFRRQILRENSNAFRCEFGTGGEDMDFFFRMTRAGSVFVWCNEAIAYEAVPPSRLTRTYMLKRALLRGKNILKHPAPWRFVVISMVALPVYVMALPITMILGHHWFMKHSIKLCDHAGRLLALIGLNPLHERDM